MIIYQVTAKLFHSKFCTFVSVICVTQLPEFYMNIKRMEIILCNVSLSLLSLSSIEICLNRNLCAPERLFAK